MHQLAVAAALTLRLAVLVVLLPFFGGRTVPLLWKLALAAVIALALTPAVVAATPPLTGPLSWTLAVGEGLRSLLVGALLAFVISVPFEAVKYAGQVVDVQIGFAIVNTIDPQSGLQISVLAQLYYLLAALFFFAVDGHHAVLAALVQSCTLVPLFAPLSGQGGAWLLLQEFGAFFRIGLQVAAPCALALLLVSTAMGVIVKTVPQINILVVGFPIKIAVGLAVLGMSLPYFRMICGTLWEGMGAQAGRLLAALQ
jgi:flagellar biosynthetic protein FliR